jgi:phage shock protein PspC (stress-responsive transcriptional regulator)
MIAGVCGGLGNYAKIDPTLVRLIAVVLFFINAPAALLGYLVLALVVPEETVDTPRAD